MHTQMYLKVYLHPERYPIIVLVKMISIIYISFSNFEFAAGDIYSDKVWLLF